MDRRELKGTVGCVLNGAILVIIFDDPKEYKGLAVSLSYVNAPKLNFVKPGSEPFAFEAWNHLREKVIGKKVILRNFSVQKHVKKSPLGPFNLAFGQVLLDNMDLGDYMANSGYVRLSDNCNFQRLADKVKNAEKNKLGMYDPKKKYIMPKIKADMNGYKAQGDFDAIVESVMFPNNISLYLLPKWDHIHLRVLGLKSRSKKLSDENNKALQEKCCLFLNERIVHRKIRVRLFNSSQGGVDGIIIDSAHNALLDAVGQGLIWMSRTLADRSPYEAEYRKQQALAEMGHRGRFALCQTYSPPPPLPTLLSFVVWGVVGNHTLMLSSCTEKRTWMVVLDCILMPSFVAGGYCQQYAFDTHVRLVEMLRDRTVEVRVTAVARDCVAGLVFLEGGCLNERLVAEGLAIPGPSATGLEVEEAAAIAAASKEAQKNKRGMYSPTKPAPVKDYIGVGIPESRLGIQLRGFIDRGLRSTTFAVVAPETREVFQLGFLGINPVPPLSRVGRLMRTFMEQYYLSVEVDFSPKKIGAHFFSDFRTVGSKEDELQAYSVAEDLLLCGFATVDRALEAGPRRDALVACEEKAREKRENLWKDLSRYLDPRILAPGARVRAVGLTGPTRIFMQLICDEAEQLSALMRDAPMLPLDEQPFIADQVAVEVDHMLYRGRVTSFGKFLTDPVEVELIDFPLTVKRPREKLYRPPEGALDIPRLGAIFATAFVREAEEPNREDVEELWRFIRGRELRMTVLDASLIHPPAVIDDGEGGLLNAEVLRIEGMELVEGKGCPEVYKVLKTV